MKSENHSHRNATGTRARWMIVDDNEDVLAVMREIMARFSDAEIACFNSPQAALATFESAPENFELVITDLEMPGMNGVELCRRLHLISPELKILLATGSGLVSEEAAANEGFCGLLHKPFPFAVLQNILESIGVGNFSENSFASAAVLATA
jgi:CheY-like chemotaxis protein